MRFKKLCEVSSTPSFAFPSRKTTSTFLSHPQAMTNLHPTYIDDEGKEATRSLGLVVARGTLLVVISPVDGSEEIENPFAQQAED